MFGMCMIRYPGVFDAFVVRQYDCYQPTYPNMFQCVYLLVIVEQEAVLVTD